MAHPHAKLTPFGRLLLVHRVQTLAMTVGAAAASLGISRPTAHKWLRRFAQEGTAGLEDRSSRPHRQQHRTTDRRVRRVVLLRRRQRLGPRELGRRLGLAHSTVSAILAREGLSRLRDLDRSTGIRIRYVRDYPGELIYLDMKPLARIPVGRSNAVRGRGIGYDIVHVAVDDASRLAFVQILPDDRGATAARFLLDAAVFFADRGIHIKRVMTDRAYAYTLSHAFQEALHHLQARHKDHPALSSPNQR